MTIKRRELLQRAAIGAGAAAAAGTGLSSFGPMQEVMAARAAAGFGAFKMICIVKTVNSSYWQIVFGGAKKAAADFGVQALGYQGADSEANVAGQIALLENAIVKKPDIIVFAPTVKDALDATITKAYNAGIKVILVDSAASTTNYQAFLSTDNHAGGMACADALAAAIKAKTGSAAGQVAWVSFLAGVGSLGQRDQGFLDAIKKYPGIQLVGPKGGYNANGDQTVKPVSIANDVLTKYPNLVGYFADNLYTLQGAETAWREKKVNSKKVSLVGFDSTQEEVNNLKAGTLDGNLLQDPYQMGYGGVAYGVLSALGLNTPTFLNTGAVVATPANVNTPAIQGLLLPLGKPGRQLGLK